MPKLWTATIDEHRSAVLNAILDATGELVRENGMTGLSMTALAAGAGVGEGEGGSAAAGRFAPRFGNRLRASGSTSITMFLSSVLNGDANSAAAS